MYPRSFLCEEAEIKQRTPLKKELCEIGEEAIWESRFTSFFNVVFMKKVIFFRPISLAVCHFVNFCENKIIVVYTGAIHSEKCLVESTKFWLVQP